jgi:hypothetical protein
VRNHTTELQRKEIAFVNDPIFCDAVMDSKLPRLLGEPAVPILAGTPAQNNEARKNFSFADNRWTKSKAERIAWRAEQTRFTMKTNLALATFEDFFEATSTIGVFIAKQEKDVSTLFAASQDNWLAAIAVHVQDPQMAAQQVAANVPVQDYWQDEGNSSLLPVALQATFDEWRVCYKEQHPYSRYKAIWTKLSDLFATGKKSQKHSYEKLWQENNDSNQSARAYLNNEELWIELINEASDIPMTELEMEEKMFLTTTSAILKQQADRVWNDRTSGGIRTFGWTQWMASCRNAISLQDQLVATLPQVHQSARSGPMDQRANFVQASTKLQQQGRQEIFKGGSCPRCAGADHSSPAACTATTCSACGANIEGKNPTNGKMVWHDARTCTAHPPAGTKRTMDAEARGAEHGRSNFKSLKLNQDWNHYGGRFPSHPQYQRPAGNGQPSQRPASGATQQNQSAGGRGRGGGGRGAQGRDGRGGAGRGAGRMPSQHYGPGRGGGGASQFRDPETHGYGARDGYRG